MSDGTSFSIDIPVNGAGVEPAAAAVARLAESLTASQSAARAAAEAVKAGETAYAQAEAAANRAALSVEKIGQAADAQRGKLKEAMDAGDDTAAARIAVTLQRLTERQAEAASKASEAAAAMNQQASALDKLKASASAAADEESKVTKGLQQAKEAAEGAAKAEAAATGNGKINEMAEGLGKLGGPLGQVGQKALGAVQGFDKLTASLGEAGVYLGIAAAAVAVVAAIVAITAAAVAGVAAIGQWAVGLADAARTQGLLAQGIARSVEGGNQLQATIGRLQNTVPLTSDELSGMAKKLADSGLRGDELSAALEKTATEAAKLKFGPNFSKQLLSLDSQTAKLKRSISSIFGGLKIESLLEALSKVVALFDEGSSSANAIKVLFESLFQPLIDGVTGFVPKMVSMFIQFEILVMKAAIAIKPWGSQILLVGEILAGIAAVIMGVVAVALALMVGSVVAVIAVFSLLNQAGQALGVMIRVGIGDAITWLTTKFTEVQAFLATIDLSEIGTQMIQGLINGITGAAGGVLGAITGAVGGAIDGAKKMLGIASPSKVFAEIGMHTAAGMEQGVDDNASSVQGSLEALVAPPDPGAPGGAAASTQGASGKGGSGGVFNITINAPGGDGASIASALRDLLFELNVQAGTAVPNA